MPLTQSVWPRRVLVHEKVPAPDFFHTFMDLSALPVIKISGEIAQTAHTACSCPLRVASNRKFFHTLAVLTINSRRILSDIYAYLSQLPETTNSPRVRSTSKTQTLSS